MTHTSCSRCGAHVAPWELHSDGDDDVCADCCTAPSCRRASLTDQLVDYFSGLQLVPTVTGTDGDGLLDLP